MRMVASLLTFAAFLVNGAAQSTFRSQTDLVLVPAIVTDGEGKPVRGLSKDDFDLFQDGRQQAIFVFENANRIAVPRGLPSAASRKEEIGRTGPVSIVIIDTMHLPAQDQSYARQQLLRWLETTVSEQPLALAVLSLKEFKVVHDFTTDPKVLVTALNRVRARSVELVSGETGYATGPSASATKEEADLLELLNGRGDQISNLQRLFIEERTEEYMQQIAHAFVGIPGRKSLLWVSSQPPRPMYRTLNLLSNAQIAIYPIDARGLTTPEYETAIPNIPGQKGVSIAERLKANQLTILGFRELADMTGGRAFFNRNDLDGAFREATQDASAYYLLGFYRQKDDKQVGWRKLTVKVNRKGAHVRARSGYLVPGGREYVHSTKSTMELALESPWSFTGLPFTVRSLKDSIQNDGKVRRSFEIRLAAGSTQVDDGHLQLEITTVALNQSGTEVAKTSEKIDKRLTSSELEMLRSSGVVLESHLDVVPGQYHAKFVVRDETTGAVGSFSTPVSVGIQ